MTRSRRTNHQSPGQRLSEVCADHPVCPLEGARLSETVLELTSVVDDILDQLHLLSLNIALEAHRSGRVDEILTPLLARIALLSERTAFATAEFDSALRNLQTACHRLRHGFTEDQYEDIIAQLPPVVGRAEQLSQIVFQIAALTANDLFAADQGDSLEAAAIGVHAAAVEDRLARSAVLLMRLAHKLELQT
jgi:hypothetical protein